MFKNSFTSSIVGKISLSLMVVGFVGVVFQFSVTYLPIIQLATIEPLAIVFAIFSIVALAFGAIAIIISIFKAPKWLWILLAFFILASTLIIAILVSIAAEFPYFNGMYTQIPWAFLVLPLNPMIDFIGFWMAVIGSFAAMIFGFFVPKYTKSEPIE